MTFHHKYTIHLKINQWKCLLAKKINDFIANNKRRTLKIIKTPIAKFLISNQIDKMKTIQWTNLSKMKIFFKI
jgi:hypothetical protein